MARIFNSINHPDGASVAAVQGGNVVFYTSNEIIIPPNSGVYLTLSATGNDANNGYVIGGTEIVDSSNTVLTQLGFFTLYGSLDISTNGSVQNNTETPMAVRIRLSGMPYIGNTTITVTNVKTDLISLYQTEFMGGYSTPDNHVNYPGYGNVIYATIGSWINITSVNIPAGNLITFINIPISLQTDGVTRGAYEYEILEDGVLKETFLVDGNYNIDSGQYGLRYSVQSTDAKTLLFRGRATRDGTGNNLVSHGLVNMVRLDLDKIGVYIGEIKSQATPLTSNPILQTQTLTVIPGNKYLRVLCWNTTAVAAMYRQMYFHFTSMPDLKDKPSGTSITTGAALGFSNTDQEANKTPRGDFGYDLLPPDWNAHPSGVAKFEASSWVNQTVRPGSGFFLFDLSAEVGPPLTYTPMNYLEIS